MSTRIIIAAMVPFVLAASVSFGGGYKCVDADGNVTFQTVACPPSAASSTVRTHTGQDSGIAAPTIEEQVEYLRMQQRPREARPVDPGTPGSDVPVIEAGLSSADRERREKLQDRKHSVLFEMESYHGKKPSNRKRLTAELESIDREIAAIRGAPVVIKREATVENQRSPAPPTSGPKYIYDPKHDEWRWVHPHGFMD